MARKKEAVKRVAILLAIVGFLFSTFAVTILAVMESRKQQTQQEQIAELLKQQNTDQTPPAAEALDGYSAGTFDKNVTKLGVKVIKEGNGRAATADSTVSANYFGWTSNGKIFDSSKRGGVTTPVEFPLNGVIEGWTKGLTGKKAGSVIELTIPANMAYGESGSGEIGPNEPLKFIVELKEVK